MFIPGRTTGIMDITKDRRHDEISGEFARVCDRVMRVLDQIEEGKSPAPCELRELAAEVEALRVALSPPSCPYDFVPTVPKCLN